MERGAGQELLCGGVSGAAVLMRRPCSTPGCFGLANAAGRFCDRCDAAGMRNDWSRTRDDAWLAYVDCEGIKLIPLPQSLDYDGVKGLLQGSQDKAGRNAK